MGDIVLRVLAVIGGVMALIGALALADEILRRIQHPGPRPSFDQLRDPDSDCDGLTVTWRRP